MKRKHFILALVAMLSSFSMTTYAQVAKVGNTEYETIDEAIAAWTNGTTLTLLSDVTLSDVIKLSSTEYHTLDLGTYTMTAYSKKDAIQIVNNARSSASYALDIKADAENPGGITATGKAIVRTTGKSGVKDRPIIRFYNGVFNASYIVYHSGSNGTNCPQFQFHNGVFNGTIYTNRALNQFYGGVFTGSLMMSVDSSAYTLIAGGSFKQLSNLYMSALNSGKFTIGSAKGVYDKEVYVDDNGNYVIATAEPSEGIEAAVAKTPGTNDYLAYSKVATEGALNYTNVETALKNNQSATVTVYADEVDMSGITFTGTIVVPEGEKITIVTEAGVTPTWTVSTSEENSVTYTDDSGNELVKGEDGAFVKPSPVTVDGVDVVITENGNSYDIELGDGATFPETGVTMTFAATGDANGMAYVVHEHEGKNYIYVGKVADDKISFKNTVGFSTFTVNAGGLTEAVAAAESGDIITLIEKGAYTMPEFAGKELTIKALDRENTSITDYVNKGSQGMMGSTVHFVNLTINGATENYYGLFHTAKVTYTNCIINGLRFLYATEGVSFDGCAFNANGVEHSFWTYGASNVTVKNSTFTYTDRAVNCYSENGAEHEADITFENCSFTYAGTAAEPEGAVEINSGSAKSFDIAFTDCTAPEKGAMWFNSQWDSKNGENTVVEVNGEIVWQVVKVAKIGDVEYTSLQAALDAAAAGTGNVTVTILADVNLTGVDWNPVTVSDPGYPVVTVEGNGKTITGLNDMLFAGTWAGGSGLIIKDLTIENSAIVNDKDDTQGTVGVGAFIGFPQASATITLENCHLKSSSVEGGHWTGGLIGYAAGYAGTDGPVFMNLTIKGCSVTGSTITGKGSVGGVIGHGSGNAWTNVVIEETTVSGNTITSTGSSNVKAGAVMGTIGAAGQPTTVNGVTHTGGMSVSATVAENDVKSNGTVITTIYGRQGTATGMLAVAGGTYDNYPIEEGVAYAAPAAGYKIEQNTDGTYGVVVDPAYGKVAKIGDVYYETLAEAIAAAQAGDVVKVFAGTYEVPAMKAGITIEGEVDSEGKSTVLLEGTLSGTLENLTLKNLHIKGGNAQRWAYANGNLVFENVTFEATSVYAIHFDGIKEGTTLLYKDCTIIGWAALGGTPASCKFEGCTIKDNGTYGVIRTYFDTEIEGCTFDVANANTNDVYQDGIHAVDGAEVAVTSCTNVNGEMKDLVNVSGASVVTVDGVEIKNVAMIGETGYRTLADAIAAIGTGDVVINLLTDATFDYNARDAYGTAETTSVTINGNGKTLTLNQKNSDWASLGLANAAGKLVLNNMTIEKTGYGDTSGAWNTHAIIFSCPVEMTDVTVNNAVAVQAGATLNNVTINEPNDYYGLWVNGNGQTVTVNGGAISGGRGIKVADQYIDAPAQVTLSVTDTKFTTAKKAAVLVTSTAGAKIAASNVDITEVAADNQNMVWVDEDRAAYYNNIKVSGEATKAQENVESFPIKVWYVNGEGVASSVRSYYKNLDDLFAAPATQVPGSNKIELFGNVTAANKVDVNYGSNRVYSFVTNVAEGVTMTFEYADNWNKLPKFNLGENITMNVKYLQVIGGDIEIAGNLVTDYLYLYGTGEGVTITETGVVTANTGDATVQVKGGTVLTVNGKLTTSTLNVWTQDQNNSELIVSGANAQVTAAHLHAWNGKDGVSAQKVNVENGATLTATNFQADRGSEVTVADATVNSDAITLGYDNNIGKLIESGNSTINGPINLNSTAATVQSDGGLNVTTNLEGYTVVFDAANKQYKVVAIGDVVAKIGESYYETLAAAITAAQANDVITFVNDITEDVTVSKNVTIDGAGKKYTGNIQVKGGSAVATIKNVKFMGGTGYAVTTNTINSVTIENCTASGYTYGFLYANKSTVKITIKDVAIDGGTSGLNWNYGTSATLENVTMTNVQYGINTRNYGSKTFIIKNCGINATETPIRIDEKSTTLQTFAFEGVNNLGKTVDELNLSQYAVIKGANVGTYYGTLQSMVAKADNDQTVKLLSDIAMTTKDELASCDGYPSFVHVEGKAITVDLNGKTIDADVDAGDVSEFVVGVFSTDNGGELTLVDSSTEGTGKVILDAEDGKVYSLLCNYEDGCKMTINGGTYVANKVRDCLIYSGGKTDALVTVNGGNFTLGNVGVGENGKPWIFNVLGAGDHHVLVNGGTFNADINRQHWSNEVYVAKECYTVANTDGTYTVKEGAVAYVNEGMPTGPYFIRKNIGYATLAEAIAEVDTDETVTMLKDVTLDETLVVAADKENITLNLAGKTVSMAYAGTVTANHAMIKNYGDLTIDSSVEGGKLSYTYTGANIGTSYAANTITSEPGSVLTVKGGTVENLTFDSGIIAYAIDGLTNGGAGDVTVNIEGGVITSKRQALRIFANSTTNTGALNISGGDFTGRVIVQNASAKANKAALNITGGTFNANDYKSDVLYVGGSNSATIDIDATVSGGTFKGEITETHVTGFISGGTFASDVSDYCADGFICEVNTDGYYCVVIDPNYIAELVIDDAEAKDYTYDSKKTVGTLTYKRTLVEDAWNPLYVPFALPMSELIDNYDVAYYNDVHAFDDDNDGTYERTTIELIKVADPDKVLKASYPLIIRPKSADVKNLELTLTDVTLSEAIENKIHMKSASHDFEIMGTYTKRESLVYTESVTQYVLGREKETGLPKWITTTKSLNPYRLILTVTSRGNVDLPFQAISMRIVGEETEDGTTFIYDVEMDSEQTVDYIYDLQGRRVLEPQKGGLYIVNGKKVLF